MMPSRGLRLAKGHAPRLIPLQCRHLSSASTRRPPTALRAPVRPLHPASQWRLATPLLSVAAFPARHASNTPTPPSQATPIPSTEPDTFPNLDTISLEGIDLEPLAHIPEKIGYLHEIGINYGYGFTTMLQWTIEHLHIMAGLPWWGSIVTTAVLMRVVLFPLYLKSSDSMARQSALTPVTKPLQEKMTRAKNEGDQEGMMEAMREIMAVRKRAGISLLGQMTPMAAQGFLAYCGFRLVSAMASLPVPAFKSEGPLWLQDLTVSDPYLVLPVLMAGSVHLLVRMGGETGAASQSELSPAIQKFMLYGLPVMIVGIMGFQSGALCIWFCTSGAIGMAQSLLLRRPAVRQLFGIAPMYTPSKAERGPGLLDSLWPKKKSSSAEPPTNATPGKNLAYMNPTYQSPNLRRNSSSRPFKKPGEVIDVVKNMDMRPAASRPSNPAPPPPASQSDMMQAGKPRQSVINEVSEAWKKAREGSDSKMSKRAANAFDRTKGQRRGRGH